MSLNDWQIILDDLSEIIDEYVKNPSNQLILSKRHIPNTNFEMQIEWEKLDVSFYSKLLNALDYNLVFPYVMKVKVCVCSNISQFIPATEAMKTPVRKRLVQKKKTIDKSIEKTPVILNNGNESIQIKECCVRLPVLKFDENGEVIQDNVIRNKRKHSSLRSNEIPIKKVTPRRSSNARHSVEPNSSFVRSNSSTPFVRNNGNALKEIENEELGSFRLSIARKPIKRLTNRLTSTPRTSNSNKSNSQFNPRIRLLRLPEKLDTSKKSKRTTGKKLLKSKLRSTTKRPKIKQKSKPKSIANESELFEMPAPPPTKIKTKKTNNTPKNIDVPPTIDVEDIVKVEEM